MLRRKRVTRIEIPGFGVVLTVRGRISPERADEIKRRFIEARDAQAR